MLWGLLSEGNFRCDFWKISFGPPFALFYKIRVLGDPAKIAKTWSFGHFWSRFFGPKIFSGLCPLSAYYLEDNAICARLLLGLFSEGIFLGDFWKISLRPHFAVFWKMQVLGDLAKIAITWPLGDFRSRFIAPKSFPVFAL